MGRSKELLLDLLNEAKAVLLPDFEDALAGHSVGANPRAIYDVETMIAMLQTKEGWNEDECWEWLENNIFPDYHPSQRKDHPIFLYPYY